MFPCYVSTATKASSFVYLRNNHALAQFLICIIICPSSVKIQNWFHYYMCVHYNNQKQQQIVQKATPLIAIHAYLFRRAIKPIAIKSLIALLPTLVLGSRLGERLCGSTARKNQQRLHFMHPIQPYVTDDSVIKGISCLTPHEPTRCGLVEKKRTKKSEVGN